MSDLIPPRWYTPPIEKAAIKELMHGTPFKTKALEIPVFSFHVNPVLSFLYMHMENHIEYRQYPNVLFHTLPRLHRLYEPWLPRTYTGLWDIYREMWPVLMKLRRDASFFIHREVPD